VYYLIIFLLGSIVGSFLNVLIYRIPRGESIVYPPSHCPQCGVRLKIYDNIPVLSYLLLKGRCRECGGKISPRYPIVEFLTGSIFLLLFLKEGLSLKYFSQILFVSILITLSFIDLDHYRLPDLLTIPGMFMGLIFSFFLGFFRSSLVGVSAGVLTGIILSYFGEKIFKREAFGGGDLKLLAMIGAFQGPRGVFISLFIGSLVGSITGIFMKKREIPFGPFLGIGAVVDIFTGSLIISYLLGVA
jgi:leader peptidase (prepilin peptidase)/N-methyltransferase